MNNTPFATYLPVTTPTTSTLRSIAHRLKPLVIVGQKGITDQVILQIDQKIRDHELVKIQLTIADRTLRKQAIQTICQRLSAQLVQRIGKVAVLYRKAGINEGKHTRVST